MAEGAKGEWEDLYVGDANIGLAHKIEVNSVQKVVCKTFDT